jgi:hypothetical protein
LQLAFPLYISMVPLSALTIAIDGERLLCDGFSLHETIRFGRLKFIADCFGGLSLSPRGDGLETALMGSTHNRPPSLLWAMIGDSTKEFHMAFGREGGSSLPSLRRHCAGASPAPATTIALPEDTPTPHAMTTIPPRPVVPQLDTNLSFEQWCIH